MFDGLELRTGYLSDAASFLALRDLLQDVFEIDIGRLDSIGGPDPTAMPFGYFDGDGRCVANFSAFSMPLVICGQRVRAAGYQSGAVRPEYRGRGLYRDLMARAFAWADAQGFDAGILLTDKPDLYAPHGFEVFPQHCFAGPAPQRTGSADECRLSVDVPEDLALATAMLARRIPVSDVFAPEQQAVSFLLTACWDDTVVLSHLPRLDAIAAWREDDGRIDLLDVVTSRMPTLADLLGALGTTAGSIRVMFPTDRLAWNGQPEAQAESCVLMMRLPAAVATAAKHDPLSLSPTAEF